MFESRLAPTEDLRTGARRLKRFRGELYQTERVNPPIESAPPVLVGFFMGSDQNT